MYGPGPSSKVRYATCPSPASRAPSCRAAPMAHRRGAGCGCRLRGVGGWLGAAGWGVGSAPRWQWRRAAGGGGCWRGRRLVGRRCRQLRHRDQGDRLDGGTDHRPGGCRIGRGRSGECRRPSRGGDLESSAGRPLGRRRSLRQRQPGRPADQCHRRRPAGRRECRPSHISWDHSGAGRRRHATPNPRGAQLSELTMLSAAISR